MATAEIPAASGQPKKSPVWKFFSYNIESNQSICEVKKKDKVCGANMKGKNPTNLKCHLSGYHKEEYQFVLPNEDIKSQKKESSLHKSKSRQASIQSMLKVQPFSNDSAKHKVITSKLAVFVATANVGYHIVGNFEFWELLSELEPRYTPPGRGVIRQEVSKILVAMKGVIKKELELARQVHLCSDIWSKKGMSEAFVGIVAFFIANGRKHKATLAGRNIYGSHSGSNIFNIVTEVLAEWKIDKVKLGKVLTDNGSNMLKEFRMIAMDTSPEVLDDSDDDDCVIDDFTGDIKMKEEDEFDDTNSNDDDEEHQSDVIAEVNECELRESECNLAYCSADYEKLSCFPYTLQLVVSKFDEVGACRQAIKSSKKLVAKVNKSVKATEMLKSSSGVKLIGDCPTRWSSTFLMLKQLLC